MNPNWPEANQLAHAHTHREHIQQIQNSTVKCLYSFSYYVTYTFASRIRHEIYIFTDLLYNLAGCMPHPIVFAHFA